MSNLGGGDDDDDDDEDDDDDKGEQPVVVGHEPEPEAPRHDGANMDQEQDDQFEVVVSEGHSNNVIGRVKVIC